MLLVSEISVPISSVLPPPSKNGMPISSIKITSSMFGLPLSTPPTQLPAPRRSRRRRPGPGRRASFPLLFIFFSAPRALRGQAQPPRGCRVPLLRRRRGPTSAARSSVQERLAVSIPLPPLPPRPVVTTAAGACRLPAGAPPFIVPRHLLRGPGSGPGEKWRRAVGVVPADDERGGERGGGRGRDVRRRRCHCCRWRHCRHGFRLLPEGDALFSSSSSTAAAKNARNGVAAVAREVLVAAVVVTGTIPARKLESRQRAAREELRPPAPRSPRRRRPMPLCALAPVLADAFDATPFFPLYFFF